MNYTSSSLRLVEPFFREIDARNRAGDRRKRNGVSRTPVQSLVQ
jgi:hypothetical protein